MGDPRVKRRVMSKKRSPVFSRKNRVCRPSWRAPYFFLNRALLRVNPALPHTNPSHKIITLAMFSLFNNGKAEGETSAGGRLRGTAPLPCGVPGSSGDEERRIKHQSVYVFSHFMNWVYFIVLWLRLQCGRKHYVFRFAVRPSVRPLAPILPIFASRGIFLLIGGISMKLAITIRHVTTDIAEKVFKVSGQRSLYWRDHYNGGGMRFDGVAKRLTRFIAFCRIHFIPYKDTKNTKKY